MAAYGCLPSLPAQANLPNLSVPCPVAVQRVLGEVDEQCLLSQGCTQLCVWCCCLLAP